MNTIIGGLPLLAEGGMNITLMVTLVAIILIFYFLIVRPQNKAQKEKQKMLEALKKNDKVQTIGGIRGVVVDVKEKTTVLRVDDNTKMEFAKSAISTVITEESEKSSDSKKDNN